MTWFETVRTGLAAVLSHRLRSSLTVLGILIGIAAVMLTVGLGEGAQAQVKSTISSLGANLLIITPGSSTTTSGVRGGFGSASTLTVADATALSSKVVAPDIAGVAPTSTQSESLTAGTSNWTTSVVGTTPDWLSVRSRSVSEGRFLVQSDIDQHAAVTVLGSETAEELFGSFRSPVGQTVNVNGTPLTVIGVLTSEGSTGSTDADDQAIVPITTAADEIFGGFTRNEIQDIYVQATGSGTVSAALQEANSELLALHGITTPTDADFTIQAQSSIAAADASVD